MGSLSESPPDPSFKEKNIPHHSTASPPLTGQSYDLQEQGVSMFYLNNIHRCVRVGEGALLALLSNCCGEHWGLMNAEYNCQRATGPAQEPGF